MRIGHKVGKSSYVSVGKSGTYVSTKVGGYRISHFARSKSKSNNESSIRGNDLHDVLLDELGLNEPKDPTPTSWFWIKLYLGVIVGCFVLAFIVSAFV
jgi:hypothetical protein